MVELLPYSLGAGAGIKRAITFREKQPSTKSIGGMKEGRSEEVEGGE